MKIRQKLNLTTDSKFRINEKIIIWRGDLCKGMLQIFSVEKILIKNQVILCKKQFLVSGHVLEP